MHRVEREFRSDLNQLADIRNLVRDACARAWGTDESLEVVDHVLLAVQEAMTNIIRHAYRGATDRRLRIEIHADEERIRLWLWHDGEDFDPGAVVKPAFDGSRSGGFGIHLMHVCMDEVRYIHDGGGRRGLHMARRRRPICREEKKMNLLVEQFGDVAVVTVTAEQLD